MNLKQRIGFLAWAVRQAADWRGTLTGNPDPGPLEFFDSRIKSCRQALRELREDSKAMKAVIAQESTVELRYKFLKTISKEQFAIWKNVYNCSDILLDEIIKHEAASRVQKTQTIPEPVSAAEETALPDYVHIPLSSISKWYERAKVFVDKVESGRARSIVTYKDMKDTLAEMEILMGPNHGQQ